MSGRTCPCCGESAAFRVPRRLDSELKFNRYYRCGTDGRWLYLHEIPLAVGENSEVAA
jgi:rRNA maturation protein Nop10